MKIYDMVQFDENEVRTIKTGFRWAPVILSFNFKDETDKEMVKRAIGRLHPANQHEFRRNHVKDSKAAWVAIRDELKRRVEQFRMVAEGRATLFTPNVTPLPEGAIPLVHNEKELGAGMVQNLEKGVEEVQEIIDLLETAYLAMKDPPDDEEYYESELYGEQDIKAVVVRR